MAFNSRGVEKSVFWPRDTLQLKKNTDDLIKISHLIIYFNCENIYLFQSSSKPFTYSVCLNELGANTVHQYVGQEPSGRMFNELSLDFNSKFLID